MKTKTAEPTTNPLQDAAVSTESYRDPRCEVCGHTVGAHFTSLSITANISPCNGDLSVSPVVPGTTRIPFD